MTAEPISLVLARSLRTAGLTWQPASGDRFIIDMPDLQTQSFILSDLTVDLHTFKGEQLLGFNGTVEWALDSVTVDQTLWLPHEHQLRDLLGPDGQVNVSALVYQNLAPLAQAANKVLPEGTAKGHTDGPAKLGKLLAAQGPTLYYAYAETDRIVFAGRHDPRKGLPVLLRAWARLRGRGLRLRVLGADPLAVRLLLARLRLSEEGIDVLGGSDRNLALRDQIRVH